MYGSKLLQELMLSRYLWQTLQTTSRAYFRNCKYPFYRFFSLGGSAGSLLVRCSFAVSTKVINDSGPADRRHEMEARQKLQTILNAVVERRMKAKEAVSAILSEALWKLPRSLRFQLFRETVHTLYKNDLYFTLFQFYDRFIYHFAAEHELREELDADTLAILISAFSKNNFVERGLFLVGMPSQTESKSLNIFQEDGTFLTNPALVELYCNRLYKLLISQKLSIRVLNELVKGVALQRSSYEAFLIMKAMLKLVEMSNNSEFVPNIETYTSILSASSAEGFEKASLALMRDALEAFPDEKRQIYSTIVGGFIRAKLAWESLEVFRQAESEGVQIELSFYADLLQLFAQLNEIDAVEHIWTALVSVSDTQSNQNTLTVGASECVLICAARWGNKSLAEQVFTALIERKKFHTNFTPSSQAFYCLIEARASEGDIPGSFSGLQAMCEVGYEPRLANFTKFIRICGRNSRTLDFAYHHIRNLAQQNDIFIELVNILLASCSLLGDLNRALSAYREFVEGLGIAPNEDTFHALIRGCINTSRHDVFQVIEEERSKYGVQFNSDTCHLLIRAYVRCSQLKDALDRMRVALAGGLVLPLEAYQLVGRKAVLQGDESMFEEMLELMKKYKVPIYNTFMKDIRTPFGLPEIREEMTLNEAKVGFHLETSSYAKEEKEQLDDVPYFSNSYEEEENEKKDH
ncbi:hypothetical protein GpartN1_g1241.t1 [Galdieria partita]|uniref:Pentatricopeptide repeat-containing protein-mitochondrial domain-containing protein n=1 Tax=Galdieria partita TaxID=83374 RepID=A0A9C7PS12_9RHOD|nr:hypothetical protein GpartN1_g1241.t1 [Galdieria partita]